MRCEDIQEQFIDLLYEEPGTSKPSSELLGHVRACAACRSELADLKGLQSLLKNWHEEPLLRPVQVPVRRESTSRRLHMPLWSFARYAAVAALVLLSFLAVTNADIRWDKNGFALKTSLLARTAPQQSASSNLVNREELRDMMQRYDAHVNELNQQMILRALEVVDQMRSMDMTYIKGKLKDSHTKN